jgi:hypothetical protein
LFWKWGTRKTYPELHISSTVRFHSIASTHRITTTNHLDKSVALVHVDNASLNDSELAKQLAQVRL